MDKNQLIKWALIAAAAYLIYRYVLKDMISGTGTPVQIPPPTGGGAGTQPSPTVTPAPSAPRIQVNDALLMAAATGVPGFVSDARTAAVRLTSDQWNYYRGQGGGDVPNVDLFPEGNRGYLMSIDEYLEARRSHGLSGLGRLFGQSALAQMAALNPWIT